MRIEDKRVTVMRSGTAVALSEYTEPIPQLRGNTGTPLRFSAIGLTESLLKGATLTIDEFEELHPPLRALAGRCEQYLSAPVCVNLYANLVGAAPKLALHWDDHEVWVLQVDGAKSWKLFAPTLGHPVPRRTTPPRPDAAAVFWEGELTAGDLLYVPRGWWHSVSPRPEMPSMHLSFSCRPPWAGLILANFVRYLVSTMPVARRNLPLRAGESTETQWYADLREVVRAGLDEPGLLERLGDVISRRPGERPEFGFPDVPAAGEGT
ncbi:JmjC domain-containing protein [Streptomyces sp. NPDC001537]